MYDKVDLFNKFEHEVKLNYSYPSFTVEKLLKNLKMYNSYSWVIFYDILGLSPGRYLEIIRLLHSLKFFSRKNKLHMIARLSGFSNAVAFRGAFKKHYGINPSDFKHAIAKCRKNNRNGYCDKCIYK